MENKQKDKMRNLQDFSDLLGGRQNDLEINTQDNNSENPDNANYSIPKEDSFNSSAMAYADINKQLNNWYDKPATEVDEQAQLALEWRIQELERKLEESEEKKNAVNEQLELIEKSYAVASKYMPNGQQEQDIQQQSIKSALFEKIKPVTQVNNSVVSFLGREMYNEEFMVEYSKPRNLGFNTISSQETAQNKNCIRACVYQTIKLSDGKDLQLRLLEPMLADNILIPANTILTGNAKISGERLHVTIFSIQYAENIIPVELMVYDLDGLPGFSAPSSDEVNAAKEIAANMGSQMGSSITITDNAGSQLAADLGRGLIQGTSQYISNKMRKVEVTLKANHQVLLLLSKL